MILYLAEYSSTHFRPIQGFGIEAYYNLARNAFKTMFLVSPVLNSVFSLIMSGFCEDKSGFFQW